VFNLLIFYTFIRQLSDLLWMNIIWMGWKGGFGSRGVPDPPPSSMIHHWIQFIELNILMPHFTTSDPNLTTSGQLPTGVVGPDKWYIIELRIFSWAFWCLIRPFISSTEKNFLYKSLFKDFCMTQKRFKTKML
jgi:hypothetical protein